MLLAGTHALELRAQSIDPGRAQSATFSVHARSNEISDIHPGTAVGDTVHTHHCGLDHHHWLPDCLLFDGPSRGHVTSAQTDHIRGLDSHGLCIVACFRVALLHHCREHNFGRVLLQTVVVVQ